MSLTPSTLPIIDLAPLFSNDDKEAGLRRVADEIGKACRAQQSSKPDGDSSFADTAAAGLGFFYIKNHGIPEDLISSIFRSSKDFFALPLEVKMSLERNQTNCGYVPMNGEKLNPTTTGGGDPKEAFNMGLEFPDDSARAKEPLRAKNQWPQGTAGEEGNGEGFSPLEAAQWRKTMEKYFQAMLGLGRALHRAFAVDLGLQPDYFQDKIDAPLGLLRLLRYPSPPSSTSGNGVRRAQQQQGCGVHTDYGNCTILLNDEVGGLQVQDRSSGEWISPPPIPGTFIVNIGDCLQRWSNDVYVSTPHQVVQTAHKERYSVAFFFDANPLAEVSCLPTCCFPDDGNATTSGAAKYQPITASEHILRKLDATYKPSSTSVHLSKL